MNLIFNNQKLKSDASTLFDLLLEQKLSNKSGIAIAINEEIIPKEYWHQKKLKTNDNILVIIATQGG